MRLGWGPFRPTGKGGLRLNGGRTTHSWRPLYLDLGSMLLCPGFEEPAAFKLALLRPLKSFRQHTLELRHCSSSALSCPLRPFVSPSGHHVWSRRRLRVPCHRGVVVEARCPALCRQHRLHGGRAALYLCKKQAAQLDVCRIRRRTLTLILLSKGTPPQVRRVSDLLHHPPWVDALSNRFESDESKRGRKKC
jgi:hypothetical protein